MAADTDWRIEDWRFNYCSTVWKDDDSIRHINKLLKLQYDNGDTYDVPSSEIFEKLEWTSIEKTLKNREIIMTFKALTGRSSNNIITELFSKCDKKTMICVVIIQSFH